MATKEKIITLIEFLYKKDFKTIDVKYLWENIGHELVFRHVIENNTIKYCIDICELQVVSFGGIYDKREKLSKDTYSPELASLNNDIYKDFSLW